MYMRRQPRILIVEDDPNNHPLYREVFERAGFHVLVSDNADGDFTNAVTTYAPDIISMDLMMGKQGVATLRDGFAAIELLKSTAATKNIPVIVVTNFFEEEKVRRAKALGAVDFINVPGQTILRLPEPFQKYLDHPRRYIPVHPLFRAG